MLNGNLWVRFSHQGREGFGRLKGERIEVCTGDMFGDPVVSGEMLTLAEVRLLTPCQPSKLIGLWNNSHARARSEGLHRPTHPLYFIKTANSYAATGTVIHRPAGYDGQMVFEAELGIVIGRRCKAVPVPDAATYIFGYTCANDVTARDLLRLDPAFPHWTRAKGFDGFGVFGPAIATTPDFATLRIRALLDGEEKQNYPVSDLVFGPEEIVSRLSFDMTLEAGDLIICGTSAGTGAMPQGAHIEIAIDGIGRLENTVR